MPAVHFVTIKYMKKMALIHSLGIVKIIGILYGDKQLRR
jgi:hypothetical protein